MFMHSFFWKERHQTLDFFCSTPSPSLPWSIKCITQMSVANSTQQAYSGHTYCTYTLKHTHSPALQRPYLRLSFPRRIFSCLSVLWQCYFVLRTNYCLSCFLRALRISCHSLTCGRKGNVLYHVCQWPLSGFVTAWTCQSSTNRKNNNLVKDKKYIQKYHAKAISKVKAVPHLYWVCFTSWFLILSQDRMTIISVSKTTSLYTFFFVRVSLNTANGSIQMKIHHIFTM